MPLVYQQNINEVTKLAVWHISEGEDHFGVRVPLQQEITHPHKRLQHLAGRYLLTELFEDFPLELIKIADTKKPFLPNEAFHFSISHCGDYVAVIASREYRVGVDIEVISEKVGRIKNKFLTFEEQGLLNKISGAQPSLLPNQMLTLAWGIKETLFKWYGLGSVDFKKHLHIDNIDLESNEFITDCRFLKNGSQALKVHGLLFNNNVLTWTVS